MGVDYLFGIGPDAVMGWLDVLGDDYDGDNGWAGDWICRDAFLVDADRRRLLYFTGFAPFEHGEMYAMRAALLHGWSRTWRGWSVEWAYEGTGDLVAALGEDRRVALEEEPGCSALYPHGRGEPGDPVAYVVTVDDSAVHGLSDWAEQPYHDAGGRSAPRRAGPPRGTAEHPAAS